MKREKYQNIIKLPPAIGDWTRIKLPQKSIDEISITQIKNFNFDRVSQGDLKTAHFFHYYFAKEWMEKISKDLNVKTVLYSIKALQETYADFKGVIMEKVLQVDFFHPEIGRFNFYLSNQTVEAIVNRIFGGKAHTVGKVNFTEIEKQALKVFFEEHKEIVFKLWPVTKDKDKTIIEIKEVERAPDDSISEKESYIEFTFQLSIGEEESKDLVVGYKQDIFKHLLRKKKMSAQKKPRLVYLKEETLNKIRIPITVNVGSTKISMNDLKKLQVGDVVKLERAIDEPLLVVIRDKVNFLGQPGILEKKLAIQIILPEVEKSHKLEKSVVVEKISAPPKKEVELKDDFDEDLSIAKEESVEESDELEEDILGDNIEEEMKEEESLEMEEKEEAEEESEEEEEEDVFGDEDFSWDDIDENEEF